MRDDDWFFQYVNQAERFNLIGGNTLFYKPQEGMNRADMSEILYRLLVIIKKNLNYFEQENREDLDTGNYLNPKLRLFIRNPLQWERIEKSSGEKVDFVSFKEDFKDNYQENSYLSCNSDS